METFNFLMTTTFYPPYHIGGDAVFVKYLAEELVKRGHEVHVMSGMDAYQLKRKGFVEENVQNSGVIVHRLKSSYGIMSPLSAYILGYSYYYTRRFSELVRQIRPDIVHHHNISLLGHGLLKKRCAYVSFHTMHDFWLICPTYGLTTNKGELCARKRCLLCTMSQGRAPQFWRHSQAFKSEVHNLDLIISPSEFFKGILNKVINGKIVHIPNFVPYPPENTPSTIFSDFFLYAGRLERLRGVLMLLDVFGSEDIHSRLVIVGTGGLANYVSKFIKIKGLQNKITYLGWVSHEELHSLYDGALATILLPEYPANFPLAALESLSHGTPVIASNKGGLPEIVKKVDKGLICNSTDELKYILLDFKKSKYSPDTIRAIYGKYYSPEAFLKKYFEIIKYIQTN